MKKYIIERNMPGAGQMTESDLKEAAGKSCGVLQELGTDIQWIESYVTGNKVFCVYLAENENLIREHGKKSGFPVDAIYRVRKMMDPTTADTSQVMKGKEPPAENVVRQ